MAIYAADVNSRLAIDAQAVDRLRAQAQQDPQRALKSAAHQFEAIFMNMLLKSMRDATPQDGPFDNEQTRLYTALLDQQLAQTLSSSRGIGLADLMVKQLSGNAAPAAAPAANAPAPADSPPGVTPGAPTAAPGPGAAPDVRSERTPRAFLAARLPDAQAASAATGIPPTFLLAQAALESGWGRHEIRGADGKTSFNLFGIKAGRSWSGPVVEAQTTEYSGGVAYRKTERFRAYGSYAESFRDYANLLLTNPRYAALRDEQDPAAFAQGLQRAGYATDPRYAEKLLRVLDGMAARAVA